MGDPVNYTDISLRGSAVVVYNAGNEHHDGLRIVLSFKGAEKGRLTFSASGLREHPDLIIPRFSNDGDRFDHFKYRPVDDELSTLSAVLYLTSRDRAPRRVSVGLTRNTDLAKLDAFMRRHGGGLRRE